MYYLYLNNNVCHIYINDINSLKIQIKKILKSRANIVVKTPLTLLFLSVRIGILMALIV